jgi:ribosome-binding protein aMBF1 (putative translation factor)
MVRKTFFECVSCGKLITDEHTNRLLESSKLNICYHCIIKDNSETRLLNHRLTAAFEKVQSFKMNNYSQLRSIG